MNPPSTPPKSIALDRETADFIVARRVREALTADPTRAGLTLEATIRALYDAQMIDQQTAVHVILNIDRFELLPPPLLFEARWHMEASEVEKKVSESMSPFASSYENAYAEGHIACSAAT